LNLIPLDSHESTYASPCSHHTGARRRRRQRAPPFCHLFVLSLQACDGLPQTFNLRLLLVQRVTRLKALTVS